MYPFPALCVSVCIPVCMSVFFIPIKFMISHFSGSVLVLYLLNMNSNTIEVLIYLKNLESLAI